MPSNVVGTAYVLIRALTQGVKRDIERGVREGSRQATPGTDREGRRLGRRYGDSFGRGIEQSTWPRIVSRSIRQSTTAANREIARAHAEALRMNEAFERRRRDMMSRSIQRAVRDERRIVNSAHTEALRMEAAFERQRQRVRELGARARERSVRESAIREIQETIKVSRAYEQQSRRIRRAVDQMRKRNAETLREVSRDLQQTITNAGRRAEGAADRAGRRIGRRIGRGIGQEFALQIRRLPILPFIVAAFAPVIAGAAKIIAAYIGELTALFAPLGPVLGASILAAAGAITALGGAFGVLVAALKTESPTFDRFEDRLEKTKDRFRDLGKEIQGVTLESFNRSIERVTDALLPRFRLEMLQTGRTLALTGRRLATLSEDSFFQARFATVLASNNRVLESFSRAVVFLTDSIVTLLAAASPLTERFADYVRRLTQGWSETLRLSQETGRLSAWFQRVGDQATVIFRVFSQSRQAIGETFRIASRHADDLWGRLDRLTARWLAFVRSTEGRNTLVTYFDQAARVVREVNGLFVDMFRAMFRGLTTNSDGLIEFVRTLRFAVLPSIASMASAFAGMAPIFGQLAVSIAKFFETLAQSGMIATFMQAMMGIFRVIEGLLSLPVVGTVLQWTLSFLALGRALNIVTLGAFTRALAPLGGMLGTFAGRLGGVASAAVAATAATGAAGGLTSALGGLSAALGGPVGVGIITIIGSLGLLMKKHLDARQAAEQHEATLREFAGTLDKATGAVTAQTREWAANEIVARGWDRSMAQLGVSTNVLTDALLGNVDAQTRLSGAIDTDRVRIADDLYSRFNKTTSDGTSITDLARFSQESFNAALEAGGSALNTWLGDAMLAGVISSSMAVEIREAAGAHNELEGFIQDVNTAAEMERARLEAVAAAAGSVSTEVRGLADAMVVLADGMASADDKARALDGALRILEGGVRDADQAERDFHETLRRNEDAFVDQAASAEKGKTVYLDFSEAINKSTGEVDNSSQVMYEASRVFQDLDRDARAAALAIAENGGSADKIAEPLNRARQEFIGLMEAAGATPAQIEAVTNALFGIPVETIVELILQENVGDGVDAASQLLAEFDGTQAIAELFGNDVDIADKLVRNRGDLEAFDNIFAEATAGLDDAEAQRIYLQVLQILSDIDNSQVEAKASLEASALHAERANILARLAELDQEEASPEVDLEISALNRRKAEVDARLAEIDARKVVPTADLDKSALERERTRIVTSLDALHRMKPTPQTAMGIAEFNRKKSEVDRELNRINNRTATPNIRATDNASGTISTIQNRLNNLRSKTITITANYKIIGQGFAGGIADGGVVRKGSIRQAAAGMIARREPMIAAGGSNILWAEPETGAESYIPWARTKRPRALRILKRTAREFGLQLVPMAEGGIVSRMPVMSTVTTNSNRSESSPQFMTGPTFQFNVDGPEVERRAREIAMEAFKLYRRSEAVRSRIPRG